MCSRAQPRTHTSSLERQRSRTCQQQHRCGLTWSATATGSAGEEEIHCVVCLGLLAYHVCSPHTVQPQPSHTAVAVVAAPPPPCYRCCTTQSQAAQAFQMNAAEDMPESRPAAAAGGLGTRKALVLSVMWGLQLFSSRSLNHQAVEQGACLQHSGIGSAAPATTHAPAPHAHTCSACRCCLTRTHPGRPLFPLLPHSHLVPPPAHPPCPPNSCTHLTHHTHLSHSRGG